MVVVVAVPPVVVSGVVVFVSGHASNSHVGPIRPTDEPSGHTFASAVQVTGLLTTPPRFCNAYTATPINSAAAIKTTIDRVVLLIYSQYSTL